MPDNPINPGPPAIAYHRLGIVILATLWLVSSHACGTEPSPRVLGAFTSFDYVGKVDIRSDQHLVTSFLEGRYDGLALERLPTISHGLQVVTRPQRIEAGFVHIFHSRSSLSNEDLAIRVIPQRLRAVGIEVEYAPKSERELVYSIVGGPFFRIKLIDQGRTAYIWNSYDARLADAGAQSTRSSDDFFLLYVN